MLDVFKELAELLIGPAPEIIPNEISSRLYLDDKNLIDISKLKLTDGEIWDFGRKVYLAAYNLEKYTLDLIKKEDNKTIEQCIEDLDKPSSGKKYVSYLNGPFFNTVTGISIGKRKIGINSYDILLKDYYSPWEDGAIPENMRGFGYKNVDEEFHIDSPISLPPKVFEDSIMYFEGTPLIMDLSNKINNFSDKGIDELLDLDILKTKLPTLGKTRNAMGLPFIGISNYNSKKYLITLTLDNTNVIGISGNLPNLHDVFNMLNQINVEIGTEKLIFTDGSDSLLLKYSSDYKHIIGRGKNPKMPFFIGIREK